MLAARNLVLKHGRRTQKPLLQFRLIAKDPLNNASHPHSNYNTHFANVHAHVGHTHPAGPDTTMPPTLTLIN